MSGLISEEHSKKSKAMPKEQKEQSTLPLTAATGSLLNLTP